MGARKGILYAALERLNALMAIGEKRSEAKAAARVAGEQIFVFSDGKMHAYQTRTTYQKIIMRFIQWCRSTNGINRLEQLDEQADALASSYLATRTLRGYSAWTLQTERSALRLFFSNRHLAETLPLPPRRREHITRSRRSTVRDKHFQPKNWQPLINFCLATGLRREELRDLLVRDVSVRQGGKQLIVHVRKGKGGKERQVPVFPGRERSVLCVIEGRDPNEHIFDRLPSAMDIHAFRRQFAQELYMHYANRSLPPQHGRLQSGEFDQKAAEKVTRCLGHNRLDIIFGHYIR